MPGVSRARIVDKELPEGQGVLMAMYDAPALMAAAIERFPAFRGELQAAGAELHIQMSALAGLVRLALGRGESAFPLEVCAFLAESLAHPRAVSEIANAVYLSFLSAEELQASEAGRAAWQQMPQRVRQALRELA
jgi:predicted  nucleic acid-binding Zn ribbon protein